MWHSQALQSAGAAAAETPLCHRISGRSVLNHRKAMRAPATASKEGQTAPALRPHVEAPGAAIPKGSWGGRSPDAANGATNRRAKFFFKKMTLVMRILISVFIVMSRSLSG